MRRGGSAGCGRGRRRGAGRVDVRERARGPSGSAGDGAAAGAVPARRRRAWRAAAWRHPSQASELEHDDERERARTAASIHRRRRRARAGPGAPRARRTRAGASSASTSMTSSAVLKKTTHPPSPWRKKAHKGRHAIIFLSAACPQHRPEREPRVEGALSSPAARWNVQQPGGGRRPPGRAAEHRAGNGCKLVRVAALARVAEPDARVRALARLDGRHAPDDGEQQRDDVAALDAEAPEPREPRVGVGHAGRVFERAARRRRLDWRDARAAHTLSTATAAGRGDQGGKASTTRKCCARATPTASTATVPRAAAEVRPCQRIGAVESDSDSEGGAPSSRARRARGTRGRGCGSRPSARGACAASCRTSMCTGRDAAEGHARRRLGARRRRRADARAGRRRRARAAARSRRPRATCPRRGGARTSTAGSRGARGSSTASGT